MDATDATSSSLTQRKRRRRLSYSNKGLSRCLDDVLIKLRKETPPSSLLSATSSVDQQQRKRLIARIRRYSTSRKEYGDWEYHYYNPDDAGNNDPWSYSLKLGGGNITFHPNAVDMNQLYKIQEEMKSNVKLYRQYKISNNLEPRVHGLYHVGSSSTNNNNDHGSSDYIYHGIKMKSKSMDGDILPNIKEWIQSSQLAKQTKNDQWTIGVDLICYRDGCDKIGWHADDTQEEDLIYCLTVSTETIRTICIQPKQQQQDLDDDVEQIELFPGPGDMYGMDGMMQRHYVHAMLALSPTTSKKWIGRRCRPLDGKRFAIVLRRGKSRLLPSNVSDNGRMVRTLNPPTSRLHRYEFGMMKGISKGKSYIRSNLIRKKVHQMDQRGVSGNARIGCEAIIVCLNHPIFSKYYGQGFSKDGNTLTYICDTRVGAGALIKSFERNLPIRVFSKDEQNNNDDHVVTMKKKVGKASKVGRKPKRYTEPSTYTFRGLFKVRRIERLFEKDDDENGKQNNHKGKKTKTFRFHMTIINVSEEDGCPRTRSYHRRLLKHHHQQQQQILEEGRPRTRSYHRRLLLQHQQQQNSSSL